MTAGKSDGSSADYYVLPPDSKQLQDLISHRNMNAQIGEIFRACYRYGIVSHSDMLRDAKKIKFYAEAEIARLEKLAGMDDLLKRLSPDEIPKVLKGCPGCGAIEGQLHTVDCAFRGVIRKEEKYCKFHGYYHNQFDDCPFCSGAVELKIPEAKKPTEYKPNFQPMPTCEHNMPLDSRCYQCDPEPK